MTITVVDFINFAAIFPMIVLKEIFIESKTVFPDISSPNNAPRNDPINNPRNAPIRKRNPVIAKTAVFLLPPENFTINPLKNISSNSRKTEITKQVMIIPGVMRINPVDHPQIKAPMLMRNVPGIPNHVTHTRIKRTKIPLITATVDMIATLYPNFSPLVPIP